MPRVVAPPLKARRDYRVPIVGYGSARPQTKLRIVPLVSGEIVFRAENYDSGRYVRKGQELFRIDRTDYQLAVDSARATVANLKAQLASLDQEQKNLVGSRDIEQERVELARQELERTLQLRGKGAVGKSEVTRNREMALLRRTLLRVITNKLALIPAQRAQLTAQMGATQAQLKQAETNLKRTSYYSPVTGRIIQCRIEVGERVQAGESCGELYGVDVMEVPVSVPAGDLQWIDEKKLQACRYGKGTGGSMKDAVQARVQWEGAGNGDALEWRGCVDRVEAGLVAQTRTAVLVVRVNNPGPDAQGQFVEAMLDINMFCRVTVLGKVVPRAFVIPRNAIQPDSSVYVVNDGRLARRTVKVARFTEDDAVILPGGGIAEADRVIVSYIPKPVINMPVSTGDETPTRPAASKPAEAQ